MRKELVKQTIKDLTSDKELQHIAKLDVFNALINEQPPAKWLKTNPYANNSKYLPIDKVELLLTKLFKEWWVEIKNQNVMFNSVYVTVTLHYYNPAFGKWQKQDGIGAKQIQTKKGSSPAEMQNINNNAVEIALPIAKVNAMKDAAHNVGAIFGGNLNRKEVLDIKIDEVLQDKAEKVRLQELIKEGYKPTKEEKEKYGL